MSAPEPAIVRYGEASLSDLMPSVLSSLGVPDSPNVLGLPSSTSTVVLLIDGLGWNSLHRHADAAPFLAGLAGRSLTAGFPTTTAASIASLGTGLPSGQHGLTGYTSRLPELSEPINWLTWQGAYSGKKLLKTVVPEDVQPLATALEQAAKAGIAVSVVSSHAFRDSGLTRAALRGADYRPSFTAADTATIVAAAAGQDQPNLTYCYNSELDLIGHGCGAGSEAWRIQLELIDHAAELLASRLPEHTRLLITADHGMVDVPDHAKVDYDREPQLSDGVALIAGEARARYLHVVPGSVDQVRQNWSDRLGSGFAVWRRDELIDAGWYGPQVRPAVRDRIGDLIVLARADGAVVRRRAEQRLSTMTGHHGSVTDDELLVPLLQG